jgi:phosphatidate cytidylyltransferase
MKRSQAKKDSGQLLPGHGGILDRIDGLVLVSPIYYIFLSLVLVYES